jgi:methionyl-tRNA synthetase
MNYQKINDYIKLVWDLINDTNKYFNDKKPWELVKIDKKEFENVLFVTCELIKRISIYIHPIIPNTSKKILNMLGIDKDQFSFDMIINLKIENLKVTDLSQLFPRIE